MRAIKFRAWLVHEKKYVEPFNISFASGIVSAVDYDNNGKIVKVIQGQFVLEQDTGLKDKNSKEIWEGDIVSTYNGDVIGKISQHKSGEWRIEWIGIYGGSSSLYDEHHLCEVIGSIHENPELPENTK